MKVALHPYNPSAASYYDAITQTNLFLSVPVSGELNDQMDLSGIKAAINAGTLIIIEGKMDGIKPPTSFPTRCRWSDETKQKYDVDKIMKKWNDIVNKLSAKAETTVL